MASWFIVGTKFSRKTRTKRGKLMKTEAMIRRIAPLLPEGESVLAAAKAIPRGSAHDAILGIAGAVGGGVVSPGLAGAGVVAASGVDSGAGSSGREEREEAGLDVGRASQVLLVVTESSILLFALSALGRPKDLTAQLDRSCIASVAKGTVKLFGQKMEEIVITTDTGSEIGFGVAKVHRSQGREVMAALSEDTSD
jgi:hypothetical protein